MTLYETKMGVLKYDSVTRKVTPCTAKGKLSLKWIEDEKHLTWTSDDQATSDLDLIVFAGDAKFDNYKNNIFILSFQTYEDKYFFWLQEEGVEPKDVQKKIQDILNLEEPEEHNSGMEVEQIKPDQKSKPMQVEKPAISANKIQGMQGLQGMIERIMKKNEEEKKRLQDLSLSKLFNGDFLKTIEQNASQDLLKLLPQGQQSKQFIRQNIYSPQLQQALDNLDQALYSDSASSLFYEMGLDLKILQSSIGTQALLKALVKWAKDGGKK